MLSKKKFLDTIEKHCAARHCGVVGVSCDHVEVGLTQLST